MAAGARAIIAMTSHDRLGETGRSTGAYYSEVAHAWSVLAGEGFLVDLASVRGGPPPMEGMNLHDPVQRSFQEEPEMQAKLASTIAFRDVDQYAYDVLFLAGGHGAAWDFPDDPGLAHLVRVVYENGGAVAAVCHGPAGLVNVKLSDGRLLVEGRHMSAFTNDEERAVGMVHVVPFLLADELTRRGATVVPGPSFMPHVVSDGRLVTGQNPASAGMVAVEAVRAFAGSALRT